MTNIDVSTNEDDSAENVSLISQYGTLAVSNNISNMLIVIDDEYYTISNGKIIKTTLDIKNTFIMDDFIKINKGDIKRPFKLIVLRPSIDTTIYKSIELYIGINNAYILVNATDVIMNDIKFKSNHKMLVSDDLKTWYNYYDEKVSSTITIDIFNDEIDNLKKYLIKESKPINHINKKFNYMLIQLNFEEYLDAIYENVYADYRLSDFETDFLLKSSSDKSIEVTTTFDTDEILIYLLRDNNIDIVHSIKELKL